MRAIVSGKDLAAEACGIGDRAVESATLRMRIRGVVDPEKLERFPANASRGTGQRIVPQQRFVVPSCPSCTQHSNPGTLA